MAIITDLSVVVVHRNQGTACRRTVADLRAQTAASHIIVVDNDSTEPHRDQVRYLDDVEWIDSGANLGFGPGANVGLQRWLNEHTTPWAVVMPHDARLGPTVLDDLVRSADGEGRVGLLCADVGDQARPTWDRFMGALPGAALSYGGFEPADYPHGTLLMINRQCANDVGLFSPEFFAYCEEADLGWRARAHGWQVGLARGVDVDNPGTSGSGAIVDYLKQRNTLYMTRQRFGRWPAVVRSGLLVVVTGIGEAFPSRRSPWFDARARIRGLRDAAAGRLGPPPPNL